MIDKDTVKHVAQIARINLLDEELDKFAKQLNDVFEDFKVLDELDVENIPPSFHPIRTENVLREDEIKKGLSTKEIFSQSCHKEDNYYKTPKVV